MKMLSVQLCLRTCRLQVIGTQQLHVSARLCSSKDASSSSDSDSGTNTPMTKKRVAPQNVKKSTTRENVSATDIRGKQATFSDNVTEKEAKPTSMSGKQAKPFTDGRINKQAKPFIQSILEERGKPFMQSLAEEQAKAFKQSEVEERGKPFMQSLAEEQAKQFKQSQAKKQSKPFTHAQAQERAKPFIDSIKGEENIPFEHDRAGKQARPFIESINETREKLFADNANEKQAMPFIQSIRAEQAKQSESTLKQFSGSWENVEKPAFRKKRQASNKMSVSEQLLSKTVKAAEDIASNFGPEKNSVTSELMSKFGVQRQSIEYEQNLTSKQLHENTFSENRYADDTVSSSWSYKLTVASTFVESPRVPLQHYVGNQLRRKRNSMYFISVGHTSVAKYEVNLDIWDAEYKKYMNYLCRHSPQNAFEEMIQWTEKGLLWKFPIDNEQDMEDEYKVHFSEHVFLDRHLKGWCPMHGPIRHFMDLVCVGLSKNPYMTVKEKIDNIMWYRDYFAEKSDILLEVGAITERIPKQTLELTE